MSATLARGTAHGSAATYVVEVAVKYGLSDPAGAALLPQIATLGIAGIREARVSALYQLSGRLSATQVHQIARDLLTDPVIQEYRMDSATPSPAFLLGPHWRLEVWAKPSVTDPVGLSVCQAVADLGLPAPDCVRTGTAYQLLGRIGRPQAEKILSKLLANPVIHRTQIEAL